MFSDINIKIDRDKCTACGICVDRCIMDNLRLSVAPCRQACPLNMNCQSYIRFLAQDREDEAIKQVVPYLPFLGILGRICDQPCEAACERGDVDGPVHIRAIKRYLADVCRKKGIRPEIPAPDSGLSAAVIGSGPAGLMAAYRLRMEGHAVTVIEAGSQAGGLMRSAIPAYRLPNEALDECIDMLRGMGIRFQFGQRVASDSDLAALKSQYGVLVAALGAGKPLSPSIEGMDSPKVIQAMDLLKDIKQGKRPELGGCVAVVGGGETGIDAALACKRLGVESVQLVCLERPDEMPASQRSLAEIRQENILLENCWGVSRISEGPDGGLELALSRCLSVFNPDGEFAPMVEPVCRESLLADTVILATGQKLDDEHCPGGLSRNGNGCLAADPTTYVSPDDPKVFICGDAHSGPSSVVHAMASGQEAALSAHRLLDGSPLSWERGFWNFGNVPQYQALPERAKGGQRCELPGLAASERNLEDEMEFTLSAEQARVEAERCLSCGRSFEANKTCWFCLPCEIECPTQALLVKMPYQVR